jgi:hypothetical protein
MIGGCMLLSKGIWTGIAFDNSYLAVAGNFNVGGLPLRAPGAAVILPLFGAGAGLLAMSIFLLSHRAARAIFLSPAPTAPTIRSDRKDDLR